MHPRALAAQALALKELDRLDEALEAARRAALAAPESPEPHNAMGQVFQAMGRFEPALAAYDRAAALPGPAQQDAIANRAALFMEFGRKAEARRGAGGGGEGLPRRAGDPVRPDRPQPLRTGRSADRADAGAAGAARAISLADRTTLHFGLGKAYLDLGDSAEAFRHYDEGNRLKRATFAYDADATDAGWRASPRSFRPRCSSGESRTWARVRRLPVFVVGMPRSGTTLVEQILAVAPDGARRGRAQALHARLVDADRELSQAAFATLTPTQLKAMGEAYLAHVAPMAAGGAACRRQDAVQFPCAGMIRLILPDARIIHCRRDPVDTCLSCYTKLFAGEQAFTYDQTELGRFHRAYQALMAHWRAVLPASHFLEVDYEAVVDDVEARGAADARLPRPAVGRRPCLRFHETERPVRTASVNQVRQPIYRSSSRPLAQARG